MDKEHIFLHAGVYKSLFASLAQSTQRKTTHNCKTPSFLLHVPRKIYGYSKTHTCIHTHKTQAKDAAKGKKCCFSLQFPCFLTDKNDSL